MNGPPKLKPLKDVDSVNRSLFIKVWARTSAPLCVFGFVFGKLQYGNGGAVIGIILGVVRGILPTLLFMYISEKLGNFAAIIYRGSNANTSIKEQLEGDLNQVRYHKMNKQFDQALIKVDAVLTKIPDDADALYLKASILWEGFNEPVEAKRHLHKILKMTSKTDQQHSWASTLYKNIVMAEKQRLSENVNDTG